MKKLFTLFLAAFTETLANIINSVEGQWLVIAMADEALSPDYEACIIEASTKYKGEPQSSTLVQRAAAAQYIETHHIYPALPDAVVNSLQLTPGELKNIFTSVAEYIYGSDEAQIVAGKAVWAWTFNDVLKNTRTEARDAFEYAIAQFYKFYYGEVIENEI